MAMSQDQVLSIIRAILLAVGTFIVTTASHQGWVDATSWDNVTGAVLVIASVVWSMLAHSNNPVTRTYVGSTK